MMRAPWIDAELIAERLDSVTIQRGRKYLRDERVLELTWDSKANALTSLVQGGPVRPYRCMVLFHPQVAPVRILATTCTCPMRSDCKHIAATLFALLAKQGDPPSVESSVPAVWRTRLAPLMTPGPDASIRDNEHTLGLQFRVSPPAPASRASRGETRTRLEVRPVIMGERERWIAGGINWQNLDANTSIGTGEQRRLLHELAAVHRIDQPYARFEAWLQLQQVRAPLLWAALRHVDDGGIALVNEDRTQSRVRLLSDTVSVGLDVVMRDGNLVVSAPVVLEGEVVDPSLVGFIGSPAIAVFAWEEGVEGVATNVRLAQLQTPLDDAMAGFATMLDAVVPAAETAEFTDEVLPMLRARHHVASSDGSFALPELPHPVLELHLHHFGPARAEVSWFWRYVVADQDPEQSARLPLWPGRRDESEATRDEAAEARILADVNWLIAAFPYLGSPTASGHRLASIGMLTGMSMLTFIGEPLSRLISDHGVLVTQSGEYRDYRAAAELPKVAVGATERPGNRDWLDLTITVTVEGEAVPFDELFRALAAEDEVLVLDSGTYLRLDIPELAQLRALIDESRALQEHARDGLGISRYHVDMWAELERIGVVDLQAGSWRSALTALAADGQIPARVLPGSVNATLRSYQSDGFAWLGHLFDHDLGGILADDMGLGKTLQVIALIADERARKQPKSRRAQPWLVVAPASVVHNWEAELRRFAPSLKVATVQQTSAKRGQSLADLTHDADVVITSYAIFRLDFDAFEQQEFTGLVLDEAQFVKNHQSKAYGCARRLNAKFKLAVTGTPMENNLMELWSLLSITAPGLFPNPKRFAEFYQRPIEREADDERLELLRRRIAPFMLRRTKDDVASDLPPKQEQVLELDLHPRHRKIYDTQLQRERQRVLGLLDDMDANRFQIFQSLTLLRQLSLDASLVDESHVGVPSAKLDALMEMLEDVVAEGHRVLVFSQFTRYLALAKARLDEAGVRYAYLDGRTKRRDEVIDSFRNGQAPVFLISLKAGGFGLNLTEADYVVLLDPWWNPATEAQAVDRAHRIGQAKTVMVYRLVSRDTIEEKVMALKAEKAALFEGVMSEAGLKGTALTADDIRDLLQ